MPDNNPPAPNATEVFLPLDSNHTGALIADLIRHYLRCSMPAIESDIYDITVRLKNNIVEVELFNYSHDRAHLVHRAITDLFTKLRASNPTISTTSRTRPFPSTWPRPPINS